MWEIPFAMDVGPTHHGAFIGVKSPLTHAICARSAGVAHSEERWGANKLQCVVCSAHRPSKIMKQQSIVSLVAMSSL